MLNYNSLRNNERVFLATTSVTVLEFQILLIAFAEAFAETAHRTVTGEFRFRKKGGGQFGKLPNIEDKLLFILSVVYLELCKELPALKAITACSSD